MNEFQPIWAPFRWQDGKETAKEKKRKQLQFEESQPGETWQFADVSSAESSVNSTVNAEFVTLTR